VPALLEQKKHDPEVIIIRFASLAPKFIYKSMEQTTGSRQGPMAGFCEHGDEPSGSINEAGYFLIS
jgi:hypothetical protein